ncbi:hypothetical protein ACTFIW_005456 [Dictyostelium discoideum]
MAKQSQISISRVVRFKISQLSDHISRLLEQSNQELQLATEERSIQSHPTSIRSNLDGSSMEAMSGLPTTHSLALYPGNNGIIQFDEGFYNTDLPNLEISNMVSDDSSSSSSSSSSHVSQYLSLLSDDNILDMRSKGFKLSLIHFSTINKLVSLFLTVGDTVITSGLPIASFGEKVKYVSEDTRKTFKALSSHSYYGEKLLERIRKCELDAVKHQEESSRMFQNMKQMATFGPFGSFGSFGFGSFGSFVDPPPLPTNSLHEEESYTEEEKEAKELLLSNSSSSIEEISLFSSYDYVLTIDASESGAGATLKKGNKIIKTWPSQGSTTQSNMSPKRRGLLALLMAYQALWWSDTRSLKESEFDWRAYSRDELQIIVQSDQELQLATEEGNVFIRISPEQSNEQLLNNQNECTPPQLESMKFKFTLKWI